MQFRRATMADRGRVEEICKDIWEGTDYIPNIYEQWVQDEEGEFTLVEDDGQVVGMGKLTISEPGIGWLEGLRVATEARNRGFARELTTYFFQRGREEGLRQLRLSTYHKNDSVPLIENFNFKRVADFYITEKKAEPTHKVTLSGEVLQAVPGSAETNLVIDQLLNAPELKIVQDYVSYGWLFKKLTRELLVHEVEQGHVYYLKDATNITGAIVIYPDQTKDKGFYYPVMVTGSDEAIGQLIDWTPLNAVERWMKMLGVMIPADERVKKLYFERGFENWEEDKTLQANVFVYEYDLKRGE